MTVELQLVGSQTNLASSQTALADAGFEALATTISNNVSPSARFVLNIDQATAPDIGSRVNLYYRPLNIEGANDGPVPDDNYRHHLLGSFAVDNVTGSQYYDLITSRMPVGACEIYVENTTGQAFNSGWNLYYQALSVQDV